MLGLEPQLCVRMMPSPPSLSLPTHSISILASFSGQDEVSSSNKKARGSSSPGKMELLEGRWRTKQEAWSTSVVPTKPLCIGLNVYIPFSVHGDPADTVHRPQGGVVPTEGGCGLKSHLNPWPGGPGFHWELTVCS